MKALEIPTHPKTGVSIEALELALREGLVDACLLIPNANNQLGHVMPDENKKRLAALLAQHDVPLIEDDVYGGSVLQRRAAAAGHFFQAVLADFISGSSYDNQVRKMRRVLAQRIAQMSDAVAASFPAECSLSEPQGACLQCSLRWVKDCEAS